MILRMLFLVLIGCEFYFLEQGCPVEFSVMMRLPSLSALSSTLATSRMCLQSTLNVASAMECLIELNF